MASPIKRLLSFFHPAPPVNANEVVKWFLLADDVKQRAMLTVLTKLYTDDEYRVQMQHLMLD